MLHKTRYLGMFRSPGSPLRALGPFLAAAACLGLTSSCGEPAVSPGAPGTPPSAATAPSGKSDGVPQEAGIFRDVADESGLDFVHFNGMSGELYFSEMMGSGGAFLDYDNDGDLDVYLVQGRMLDPSKTRKQATFPPAQGVPLTDRLFRNDLGVAGDGSRTLRFTDVTAASGLTGDGYGMGVATGDVDNDGWTDLFVSHFGADRLWRNRGDGTFEDVTARSGLGDPRWGVPAVFLDFDRDGWLDLFVGNYIDFTVATHKRCATEMGAPNYCGPLSYRPQVDLLYRNRGDGTFEDITHRAGLAGEFGGALGAIAADFDGDGWPDIYVANDGVPNQLWMNRRDGTFSNEALLAGAAVNQQGQPEASMGLDAADFDGDGDEDLFMTHLAQETNTLFVNDGTGLFEDVSARFDLGAPSWEMTGFGTAFFDYDNDGLLDLLAVNGAVKLIEEQALAGDPLPLRQRNQLYRNLGGTFEEVSRAAGPAFQIAEVSRGAAFGDVDNDGDPDVLLTQNAGPARLLLNTVGQDAGWIGLRLADADGRDLLGAWVEVEVPGREPAWRRVRTAASYASANDARILVGLGQVRGAAARVRVRWPDDTGSKAEEWPEVPVGTYTTLIRGSGTPTAVAGVGTEGQ